MPDTFIKIASVTVGSGGASSIDFTSIPSTYTDLVVKLSGRGTASLNAIEVKVSFNGVTTNLSSRGLYGTGSAAGSQSLTYIPGLGSAGSDTSSTFGNMEVYVPNYAGSANKSSSVDAVNENNATLAYAYLTAGLWSSTAAITQVTFTPSSGNFAQYSTAVLYGIKSS